MDSNPFAFQESNKILSSSTAFDYVDPFEAPKVYGGNRESLDAPLVQNYGSNSMEAIGSSSVSSTGAPPRVFPGEMGQRERELRQREEELKRRETQLRERERYLADANGGPVQLPNWPFSCYSFLYHSIENEIPDQHQALVQKFYLAVRFTWLCLGFNLFVYFCIWITDAVSDAATSVLWATIYLAAGVPGSWSLWYRKIYYGCKQSATMQWFGFFFGFGVHIVFTGLMAFGLPSMAGCGLFVMIKVFASGNSFLGFLCLLSALLWGFNELYSVFLIKLAHTTWKSGGGDEQMKRDVASSLVANAALTGPVLAAAASQQQQKQHSTIV